MERFETCLLIFFSFLVGIKEGPGEVPRFDSSRGPRKKTGTIRRACQRKSDGRSASWPLPGKKQAERVYENKGIFTRYFLFQVQRWSAESTLCECDRQTRARGGEKLRETMERNFSGERRHPPAALPKRRERGWRLFPRATGVHALPLSSQRRRKRAVCQAASREQKLTGCFSRRMPPGRWQASSELRLFPAQPDTYPSRFRYPFRP